MTFISDMYGTNQCLFAFAFQTFYLSIFKLLATKDQYWQRLPIFFNKSFTGYSEKQSLDLKQLPLQGYHSYSEHFTWRRWRRISHITRWYFKTYIIMVLFMPDPSKQKYRKRIQTSEPTVLMVTFPESILRAKEISNQKLWYDLYAPKSYIVKWAYETLYLQIPGLHISGTGYIPFNPNFPNAGHNRQRKCMRINNQLYTPLPIDFEGIIRQNQHLGFLKIFPPTRSVVSLIGNARLQILPHLEFTIHLLSRWSIVDGYITTSEGGSLYFTKIWVNSIFEHRRQESTAHTSFVALWSPQLSMILM